MKFIVKVAVVAFLSLLTMGCYFLRQGTSLLGIYSSARPLEEVLREQDLPEKDRKFLELARDVRGYAVTVLGLKENKNYTTFIRTTRPYLSDVVSACASDSFIQYQWDFPFLGKMPYQGFFDRKDAEEEAAKLKAQGLDVMIRGVDAFSTLGWLSDPLFSYMTGYGEYHTAELITHELTHATVFLGSQGDFNENLAAFIGKQGALNYLSDKYGRDSNEVKAALAQDKDGDTFREDLHQLYLELEAVYSDPEKSREAKLEAKKTVISRFQYDFRIQYPTRYGTDNYKGFPDRIINNAYLMTYRNYNSGQGEFLAFYQACGSDLAKMIREIKKLPADEKDPLGWMRSQKPPLEL